MMAAMIVRVIVAESLVSSSQNIGKGQRRRSTRWSSRLHCEPGADGPDRGGSLSAGPTTRIASRDFDCVDRTQPPLYPRADGEIPRGFSQVGLQYRETLGMVK